MTDRMIRIENVADRKRIDYTIEIGDPSSPFGADVLEKECRAGDLEPAPPKDWQERLHKVAELTQFISETGDGTEAGFNSIDVAISRLKDVAILKQQIKELEDANRYLDRSNGKLILELRKMQEHNLE